MGDGIVNTDCSSSENSRSWLAIRENTQIPGDALAERAGIHRTYLGSIERQERNVAVDNIWRIGWHSASTRPICSPSRGVEGRPGHKL